MDIKFFVVKICILLLLMIVAFQMIFSPELEEKTLVRITTSKFFQK